MNIHKLAKNLGIDYKTVFHYLTILSESGLVQLIFSNKGGNRLLRKPSRIFLNNTTLAYALNEYLGENISKGYVRELFFIQSLVNAGVNIFYNQLGDFQTKKTIFAIGGKNKTTKQIKQAKLESFLVKDNILISSKREIPLLYFGFIY